MFRRCWAVLGGLAFLSCAHAGAHRELAAVCKLPNQEPPPCLKDFAPGLPFTFAGETKTIYRRGTGPGVIVLHEVYGITPETLCLAERIADQGYTVFLPHLFGDPGQRAGKLDLARMCLGRDFNCLAGSTSRVTGWLRGLVAKADDETGNRGVAVIGMCLTGSFPLTLLEAPEVKLAVIAQPSLPFSLLPGSRASLGLSEGDLTRAQQAARSHPARSRPVRLLALRFYGDKISSEKKIATLAHTFGDRIEIEQLAPPDSDPDAHATLTYSFEPEAFRLVLEALRQELKPASP